MIGRLFTVAALAMAAAGCGASDEAPGDSLPGQSEVCEILQAGHFAVLTGRLEDYKHYGPSYDDRPGSSHFGNGEEKYPECTAEGDVRRGEDRRRNWGLTVSLTIGSNDDGFDGMEQTPLARGISLVDEFGKPAYLFTLDQEFGLLRMECTTDYCDMSDEMVLARISEIRDAYDSR